MLFVELYESYWQLKNTHYTHLGSMLLVLAAGFIVCKFDLDKKFSELLGCLAFDSDNNLSHSTDDHNIDTDSSLESFILWGTCASQLH